ncbi:MAG: helix-turn-helix transcriptional regulator [Verrucomicrobia bacterium]|nr:helix-turn-helix transcriptional regulator [Verrucomicrobiota bacterium]MCH8512017.1 AraC family transcriptional regulator [Kiritimatiellia bacterium]
MKEKIARFDDWDRAEIHLVFCYQGEIPDIGLGETVARFNSAWLVRSGWAEVTCGNQDKVKGEVGDWLFLPTGRRLQRFSTDAEILSIAFVAGSFLQGVIFEKNLPAVLPSTRFPPLETRAVRLLKQTTGGRKNERFNCWGTEMDMREYLRLKLIFFRWLESYVAAAKLMNSEAMILPSEDPLVEEAVRMLRSLAHREELKIRDMAERLGISESQLNRRFTRATGTSLHRYYNRLRLEAALNLLRYDKGSLKEIAYEMGFKHPSNFTNWFKANAKVSPRTYRMKFQ